jgi:hypothetical protein
MLHELLQSLQWAGCPNVPVSCHSCDSMLHELWRGRRYRPNCNGSIQALLALLAHSPVGAPQQYR